MTTTTRPGRAGTTLPDSTQRPARCREALSASRTRCGGGAVNGTETPSGASAVPGAGDGDPAGAAEIGALLGGALLGGALLGGALLGGALLGGALLGGALLGGALLGVPVGAAPGHVVALADIVKVRTTTAPPACQVTV